MSFKSNRRRLLEDLNLNTWDVFRSWRDSMNINISGVVYKVKVDDKIKFFKDDIPEGCEILKVFPSDNYKNFSLAKASRDEVKALGLFLNAQPVTSDFFAEMILQTKDVLDRLIELEKNLEKYFK